MKITAESKFNVGDRIVCDKYHNGQLSLYVSRVIVSAYKDRDKTIKQGVTYFLYGGGLDRIEKTEKTLEEEGWKKKEPKCWNDLEEGDNIYILDQNSHIIVNRIGEIEFYSDGKKKIIDDKGNVFIGLTMESFANLKDTSAYTNCLYHPHAFVGEDNVKSAFKTRMKNEDSRLEKVKKDFENTYENNDEHKE